MARIRSIKPEFFQHERLFDAERDSKLPLRVAFAGLWTVSDRDGRFEWRPRALKLNVLPYDELDFADVLSALESGGFIVRYEVDGKSYGFIPSWGEHQHINVREPSSTIPGPVGNNERTGLEPDEVSTSTGSVPDQSAGKGKERKGREYGELERQAARARALATPGLDIPTFERWDSYRVAIRKPLTEHSYEANAKKIAACGTRQQELIELSISNDWQGLFPEKLNGTARHVEQPRRAKEFGKP
jgi:hypothetical protein